MANIGEFILDTFYLKRPFEVLKKTGTQWSDDKAPQLGAALAYYTVFSLAPLMLVLLAIFGLIFGGSAHARDLILQQVGYYMDHSSVETIKSIAFSASKPTKGVLATVLGVVIALFGASGVFGQLQDALNTIWGVQPKPGLGIMGFLRARFLSFAMVGGVCFLLLVSLGAESFIKGFSGYLKGVLPGGNIVSMLLYLVVDFGVVTLMFAGIFKYLPDAKIAWRDVWVGAVLTTIFFAIGKWALGLYLGSGSAGSAYGAASALITTLLWVYYSAQILLFGAEFTQVYANEFGSHVEPAPHAMRVETRKVPVSEQEAAKAK